MGGIGLRRLTGRTGIPRTGIPQPMRFRGMQRRAAGCRQGHRAGYRIFQFGFSRTGIAGARRLPDFRTPG